MFKAICFLVEMMPLLLNGDYIYILFIKNYLPPLKREHKQVVLEI